MCIVVKKLVTLGRGRFWARINSMEAEYDEVLHWEVPGPVEPGESSMAPETPGGYPVGGCNSTTEEKANSITDGR